MKKYLCTHETGEFEFFADNKTLAIDHAKHHCFVSGWTYKSVTNR